MKKILAAAALGLLVSTPVSAYDDDMMGTMINGRMETRGEREVRVPDPEMDREEAQIDREKRLNRNVQTSEPVHAEPEPYRGSLPD